MFIKQSDDLVSKQLKVSPFSSPVIDGNIEWSASMHAADEEYRCIVILFFSINYMSIYIYIYIVFIRFKVELPVS